MSRSAIAFRWFRRIFSLRNKLRAWRGLSVAHLSDADIDAKARWILFDLRLKWHRRVNRQFDRRYGTDTADEIGLTMTGVSVELARRGNGVYRPLWASVFRSTLASLNIDFSRFTFFDMGSGKGKLLMLAAGYPFRRIVGIEFSPVLHDIAMKNIALYRLQHPKSSDVVAILGDATTCVLPSGPVVCMIFNSFEPETMKQVLSHIGRQARGDDRDVIVLYVNVRDVTEMDAAFVDLDGLSIVRRARELVVLTNDRTSQLGHEFVIGGV